MATLILALVFMLNMTAIYGQPVDTWQYPLYLSNLGYWHHRIPVEVTNVSREDAVGEAVVIEIGTDTGQLPLAATEAKEIRVVDSGGNELMCRIDAPDGQIVTGGPVPSGSTFLIPATVKAGDQERYYIYFDNPAAWATGAVLTSEVGKSLRARVMPVQSMQLKQDSGDTAWPKDLDWDIRVPLKVMNFKNDGEEGLPVYVKMEQVFQRLHSQVKPLTPVRLDQGVKRFFRFENALVMDRAVGVLSEQTTYACFAGGLELDPADIRQNYNEWVRDPRNIVRDPDLEQGEIHWKQIRMGESGQMQDIPVKPEHTYLFGAMASCQGIAGDISVRVSFLRSGGEPVGKQAQSDRIAGNANGYLSGFVRAPEDAAYARLMLPRVETGTMAYQGVIMMEAAEGYASSLYFDQRQAGELKELAIWPVNPIIKVFHEDLPAGRNIQARISAAGNETEPLQLAFRSPKPLNKVKVVVIPPKSPSGRQLDQVNVSVIGYVPVDYPSNYYGNRLPAWYLKYPSEEIGSDGWSGFWPDPLLPGNEFNLESNTTQPLWIEVSVPAGADPGDYTGQIRVFSMDELIREIPWTVHVWDFNLPEGNTFGATYDLRDAEDIPGSGMEQFRHTMEGSRDKYWSYMARHRINAGEITPAPGIEYVNGELKIDFTEYDRAATFYFDVLKNPFAYMPTGMFYLFGWAFPPSEKYNEKPYPGEFPYEEADRSQLRPEYKKAYQDVLRTFWDHVSEKGWADQFILYLSDEPHMAENSKADIIAQMKALCNMIHEVDQEIPVYVSTWSFKPDWDGYIDVWGVAFNGGEEGYRVPESDLKHMVQSGDRIWYTTDGNFCTETPYLALERLLPWFGYKYGAEAYEFWGVNWLTYNPYRFGWHSYISESQAPGETSWKRYPNGDGYVIYPGEPVGQEDLVASIRLKQVREGAEDYEYLSILGRLIKETPLTGQSVRVAQEALQQALSIVNIPCAMGRYSTRILKDPDAVYRAREAVARSIEALISK